VAPVRQGHPFLPVKLTPALILLRASALLRRVAPLLSAAVPPELIAAVHAVAFEPARARFCHLCCCMRTPAGRVSQFLRSLDAPPADWPSLTPCDRRAPCRAAVTPSTLAEGPPDDIPDPAAPPPPSTSLRPSPRGDSRESGSCLRLVERSVPTSAPGGVAALFAPAEPDSRSTR
jgi:hypothetical protein